MSHDIQQPNFYHEVTYSIVPDCASYYSQALGNNVAEKQHNQNPNPLDNKSPL